MERGGSEDAFYYGGKRFAYCDSADYALKMHFPLILVANEDDAGTMWRL